MMVFVIVVMVLMSIKKSSCWTDLQEKDKKLSRAIFLPVQMYAYLDNYLNDSLEGSIVISRTSLLWPVIYLSTLLFIASRRPFDTGTALIRP